MPYDPNQPRVPAGSPDGGEFAGEFSDIGVSQSQYDHAANLLGEGAARQHFEARRKAPAVARKYAELGTTANAYKIALRINGGDEAKTAAFFLDQKQRREAHRLATAPRPKTSQEWAYPSD